MRYKRPQKIEDSLFQSTTIYITEEVKLKLKAIERIKGLPISRLIGIALDNEFCTLNPFEYPTDVTDVKYTPNENFDNITKIVRFLKTINKHGTGIDMLLICRDSIGIPDKDDVLRTVKEMLDTGFLVYNNTNKSKYKFFLPEYRLVKIPEDNGVKKLV